MSHFLSLGLPLLAADEAPEPGYWGFASYLILLLAIVFSLMAIAKTGINTRVFKNGLTQMFEQLYLFIENMCTSVIGKHGAKYIPMIFTLWIMIFTGSVLALFFPFSPTADLSFNLGMAVLCVAYVQW